MGFKGRKTSNKNPPILSHEFVIQNHADIVSCVAMLFVIGLLIQVTSPLAYMFIAVQHNMTSLENHQTDSILYFTSGWKDACAIFFYFLICIVMHAIIQEYVLDKVSKKLHLSKVKHSLFNESGQLVMFYLLSVMWGADIIFRQNYLMNIPSLWEGYPHVEMTFLFKFFYIIQLSYWLHCYPELYFQKVKREDIAKRITQATVGLALIGVTYVSNFTRVGLCLIVLHYFSEAVFHTARLLDFADKNEAGGQAGYLISKVVFVLVRLGSIILSVLTFWYGLSLSDNQGFDWPQGNFNTQFIRMGALLGVCSLQAYLMWNFITSQLARMRELSSLQQPAQRTKKSDKSKGAAVKKEKKRTASEEEVNELPEVDQNTAKKAGIRARAAKPK